jgi:two-component system sensor histidine kinase PilS (NtrC family)
VAEGRSSFGEALIGGRDEALRVRLAWLLAFRAVVVTVLVVTLAALKATSDEQLFFRASVALYAVAGAAYVTIVLGALWLRFVRRHLVLLAYGQLVADALTATGLVVLTGGVESIFVFLYSLSVLNAAIVLERRGALVLAGVAAVMYGAVFVGDAVVTGVVHLGQLPSLGTNVGSFFLVAALGGYLTGQLSTTSEQLKDARAELRQLERLNAAMLASLPSGVVGVDEHGAVVFVNQAGIDILGAPDLVGAELAARYPELTVRGSHAQGARFEETIATATRGTRVIGGNHAPLVGAEGSGRVIVFQDLTELRRLQEDVARAEQLAALGRVAAGLAHEVRNPLAAMIGCLHLLRADDARLEPDNRRMLDIVWREAERLSGLVQDFLRYARPAPPRAAVVPIRLVLEEVAQTALLGLRSARVEVVVEPELTGWCDADQLRQVMWNLVVNADAAIAGAGRSGVVAFRARREGAFVVIDVDDDGPGVPESARAQVFEPFFTTRPEGTGLGLATCQQLVRQNGGSLQVGEAPTGGARFTVRLPAAPPANASTGVVPAVPDDVEVAAPAHRGTAGLRLDPAASTTER